MMMNRHLFTFILLLAVKLASAQKISNVDFDEIKSMTEDSTLTTWYPRLIKRLQDLDTTLTHPEYRLIYYGNVFADYYDPYGRSDNEEDFRDLYRKGKLVIAENPVNPYVLFRVAVCYNQLGDKQTSRIYGRIYYGLMDALYSSGDGKSVETAYVVNKVTDEYEVLSDLRLTSTSQALVGGDTDRLNINTSSQEGDTKISELYFNVSKPLGFLSKQFKEK